MKLDQTDGCVDKLCDKHMYWDQDLWFVGSNNLCQTSCPRQMASPGLSADWSSSWRAKHTRLSSYQRRTLQSHKLSIWQSKWAHSGQTWEMQFWTPHFWVPAIWPIHYTGLAAWLLLTARSEGMVRILSADASLSWRLEATSLIQRCAWHILGDKIELYLYCISLPLWGEAYHLLVFCQSSQLIQACKKWCQTISSIARQYCDWTLCKRRHDACSVVQFDLSNTQVDASAHSVLSKWISLFLRLTIVFVQIFRPAILCLKSLIWRWQRLNLWILPLWPSFWMDAPDYSTNLLQTTSQRLQHWWSSMPQFWMHANYLWYFGHYQLWTIIQGKHLQSVANNLLSELAVFMRDSGRPAWRGCMNLRSQDRSQSPCRLQSKAFGYASAKMNASISLVSHWNLEGILLPWFHTLCCFRVADGDELQEVVRYIVFAILASWWRDTVIPHECR